MIEHLKPHYAAVLRPVLRLFVVCGVHPNHITLFGLLLFSASGWYAATGRWRVALVLVIAGACADGWDGLLAREYNQGTPFGAVLDSTVDRLTEIVLLAGLCWYYLSGVVADVWGVMGVVAAVTASLMVSYVKARAEGAGYICTGGILQRPERIIVLCFGLVFGAGFSVAGVACMTILLWGMAMVGYLTVVQRLVQVQKTPR